MNKIMIAFMATVSLVGVGGCKKKGGGMADMMAATVKAKDDMCKCKDKACTDKVQADMMKMSQDMMKNMSEEDAKKMAADMSPEDTKKMTDVSMEMAKCMSTAMGAPSMDAPPAGSAAPAAGSAAPAAGSAAPAAGSAAPAAAGGGDLPAECNDYKAMMDKLASCTTQDAERVEGRVEAGLRRDVVELGQRRQPPG